MRAVALSLDGVMRIEHAVWRDERGLFVETWNRRELAGCGIEADFVQDNLSLSRRWTLRGLHYQLPPHPQGKLLRVLTGSIHDVVVDLRRSSPSFGKSLAVRLSAQAGEALWIPPGLAHGFLALADDTLVSYKATDYWSPDCERTLLWNDEQLGLEWPLPEGVQPVISAKDAAGTPFVSAAVYP